MSPLLCALALSPAAIHTFTTDAEAVRCLSAVSKQTPVLAGMRGFPWKFTVRVSGKDFQNLGSLPITHRGRAMMGFRHSQPSGKWMVSESEDGSVTLKSPNPDKAANTWNAKSGNSDDILTDPDNALAVFTVVSPSTGASLVWSSLKNELGLVDPLDMRGSTEFRQGSVIAKGVEMETSHGGNLHGHVNIWPVRKTWSVVWKRISGKLVLTLSESIERGAAIDNRTFNDSIARKWWKGFHPESVEPRSETMEVTSEVPTARS